MRALVVMALLAGCSASFPAGSVPSRSPSADAGAGSLPAGCVPIDLRDPQGMRLDLTGEWVGDNWFAGGSVGERTFVLQLGDCVWISISDARYRSDPMQGSSILGVMNGHLSTDFAVTGDLVTILRDAPIGGFADQQTFAAVRLVIEFDADGHTLLHEDREIQVQGPRCTHPPSACPDPVTLSRLGD